MILIVDDDPAVRKALIFLLKREGYNPVAAGSPAEALNYFRNSSPEMIILDMNFSRATTGEEGIHLLRQARIFHPHTPVILMTAWGSIDLAVEGMRNGAFDFITKPWDNRTLLTRIRTAIQLSSNSITEDVRKFDRGGIIGNSKGLREVLTTVERVAASDAPVLILGENGTGKELIARALHFNSRRASGPFLEVNLGGIPSSLFESEMFGHAKGAFTGAVGYRKGRFEEADGGTIFLDEIGDLEPSSQVKMLRVLQEHTFQPLGESRSRRVDVRIVSATNVDLKAKVSDHTFREDLFYRINLITLHLPPLRERREDIPLLVRHFMNDAAERHHLSIPEISSDAMTLLTRLNYPGNIRQLKNLIERAILVNTSGRLEVSDFPVIEDSSSVQISDSSPSTLAELEKTAIIGALNRSDWNLSQAALILGITRQALYRKMEKHNIMK
ncbi:MAG: sigma-54 dependent transcriptional regulator [Muribaculaceae bacterium]|nr:sigma-54 dependent transcriptional regulator [Muribaculaceae bacterium]